MSKKEFLAKNWLGPTEEAERTYLNTNFSKAIPLPSTSENKTTAFTPFINDQKEEDNCSFSKFFTPGWKGDSLVSREVKIFKKIIDHVQKDVFSKLEKAPSFSRKIQIAIYDEFLLYLEHHAINCTEINQINDFWKHAKDDSSAYQKDIINFLNIFSFRVSVIYLLKTRFILTLIESEKIEFKMKFIQYPNSFITNEFKRGSRLDLNIRAFEQNVFSWYQPDHELVNSLLMFKSIYDKISIHELIKTISLQSEKLSGINSSYSHTISHKQFGLFLNSLLINFPLWLRSFQSNKYCPFKATKDELELISCHYSGNYLESLSLSHWLAQNHNKDLKWEQILCPDFSQKSFKTGFYLSLFNELQFLTFLTKISKTQGFATKEFLCNIVNSHRKNKTESEVIQKVLFGQDEQLVQTSYDRVVINLAKSPKSNPQHHLIQTIQQQKEMVKDNGFIFILSNKKLFLPSQKQKLESLLKEFKIESIFNFSEITGKGEIPNYLYILSRNISSAPLTKKLPCLSFRLEANLGIFQDFSQVTKLVNLFMEKFLGDPPPMHQNKTANAKLEFYQDAVLDGRLIHSSNKDSSKITHPLFFEKLMNVCRPLDYFFELQQIAFKPVSNTQENDFLLDANLQEERVQTDHIIIVDKRLKNTTKIEIISACSLESKSYEYGHSDCFYFHMFSKWPSINMHSVQEYFQSSIGNQVVDLTFNNEQRKIKRNLAKLLVPFFFAQSENLPEHINKGIAFLSLKTDDLLSKHPREIEREFTALDYVLTSIAKDYPGQVFSAISSFKKNLTKSLDILRGQTKKGHINFNNPIIKAPLIMTKRYGLYPDNKEVHISFHNKALKQIHLPLTKVVFDTQVIDNEDNFLLKFYSGEELIVSLYSSEEMILFIQFLLSNVSNIPISSLLQNIKIPSIEDLNQILASYNTLKNILENIHENIPKTYNRLINSIISQ